MKLFVVSLLILGAIVWAQEDEPIIAPVRPIRPPPTKATTTPKPLPRNKFTVVASNKIRPGKTYRVYIRALDVSRPFEVNVKLSTSDETVFMVRRTENFSSRRKSATIRFTTFNIPEGEYEYLLTVTSGSYTESKTLTFVSKRNSIFLQTSKAIYKPSETVQYRVYSIDSESNSVNPAIPATITLTDSRNNEIGKTNNVTFRRGKIEGQFLLPSKPILGRWRLSVQNGNEFVEKRLLVEEYTLSLFTASLSSPPTVSYSTTKVPITINAEYTFRQPVIGTAEITITDNNSGFTIKRNITCTDRSTIFYVDLVNDLKLTTSQYTSLAISMVFIDQKTNTKVNDQVSVSIVPYTFFLEIVGTNSFTAGGTYSYTVVSKTLDDKPAPRVRLTVSVNGNQTAVTTGNDGTMRLVYRTSAGETYLSLQASCKACATGYGYANAIGVIPSDGISLSLITDEPTFNNDVAILATTAEPIDYFFYFVTSKGVLLESGRVYFDEDYRDDDPKTVEFYITPDFRYAPTMRIYAYYYRQSDAQFFNDNLFVQFKPELPNYLNLRLRRSDRNGNLVVKPAERVSLTIETKPYSTVSLAALDQRVLQLARGQNFTFSDVMDSFSGYEGNFFRRGDDVRRRPPWVYDPYNANRANLVFFTNIPRNDDYYDLPRPLPRPEEMEREAKSADRAGSTGVKVRKDFREVFLWEEVRFYEDDYETIRTRVPEAITTYLIYGVSMNSEDGLGLPNNLPSATIYLPFFISLELPPTVRRNETLALNIQVFNYLGSAQTVRLTLANDPLFEAVSPIANGWTASIGQFVQDLRAPNGDSVVAKFLIRPKVTGVINIRINATTPRAGDAIEKPLRVIPEGVPRSITTSTLIAVDANNPAANTTLQCVLPPSAIQDTTEISATVIGDILGKALNNLDKLIMFPGGCGEQTMIGFVPDYAILIYLEATNQLTSALRAKLIQYLTAGYQNQLNYQRNDGSFSAFGNSDPNGSTWLSAYVARYFNLAGSYITVSPTIIQSAIDFIIAQQNADGSFNEPGRVIHVDMQGASGSGVALTAYVAITLTSLLPNYPSVLTARDKAIQFLVSQLNTVTDTYQLAVIAYALQTANSGSANIAYNSFFLKRTETPTEIKWVVPAPSSSSYYGARSLDIEVSAYGLLLLVAKNSGLTTSLKVVKYLTSQSNSFGGYSSSQDTVMALVALSDFAVKYTMSQANVNLQLTPNAGPQLSVLVNGANSLTLQKFDLNSTARQLGVAVRNGSTGVAIVSLICNFYEDPSKSVPSFNISYNFEGSCQWRIQMQVCAKPVSGSSPNMAIMEVRMPSGYFYYEGWWLGTSNSDVSKTETYEDNTVVIFYLNSVASKGTCVTFAAGKTFDVIGIKPGSVVINDYYDTSKQGSASFEIPAGVQSAPCRYYY